MSKEKRRVPKLRFPGFTEDWEQRKLGDLLILLKDGSHGTHKNTDAGVYLLSAKNIKNGRINIMPDDRIISWDDYNVIHKNYELQIGDILLTIVGSIGETAIFNLKTKVTFQRSVAFLRPNSNLNNGFLYTLINTDRFQNQLQTKQVVSAQPGIYLGDLATIDITYPKNILEQEKIYNIFREIENSITLHQRKLDNLKLKKKALLQKLFPKNGERYPELRFPGFTDAWEQCKLGSIGSTYTGLSGKTKEDFGHGEAQYITYLNVFQNTVSDITMTDKVEIDTTQNEVKYGDVLFTTSSETPEEVGMSSVWLGHTPNIYLNSFCFGFRPNQKIDPYFLGYSLRAPYMRDKIKILAQGISRYNISKNKVMELEISLPNNEEQSLLGIFLRNIDLGITLHQRKLDHLQLQKKALLQQMFV